MWLRNRPQGEKRKKIMKQEKIQKSFYCQLPLGMYFDMENRLTGVVSEFIYKLEYLRVDLDIEDFLVCLPERENLEIKFREEKPRNKEGFFICCVEIIQRLGNSLRPKISIEFILPKDFNNSMVEEWDDWYNRVKEIEDLF